MKILNRWTNMVIFECEANLCEANLCGADLYRADLHEANLCEANLCGANLCEANLCEANLRGADLRGANLCGANLRRANLYGADLREANLCGADLDFSSGLSLKCSSFGFKADLRIAAQLAYHFCRINFEDCSEAKEAQEKIKDLANMFHRIEECSKIE